MDNNEQNMQSAAEAGNSPLRTLAFIGLNELEKDVFRGGILVTDSQGKPLEFRCTAAIQPTAVQRTLYGGTLRAHMSIELTARPLLSALKEKPDALFATQEEFIELRNLIKTPLLIVSKQGSNIAAPDDPERPTRSELLASPSGKFEPITVNCHWQHKGDLDTTLPDLSGLFSRFDLIEPFSRINNALKLLHEKGAVSSK